MTELPAERGGMTREHSDTVHAMGEAIGGFSVTAYDIAGCPKGVWLPHHYRDTPERTCRCDELEDALVAYALALTEWTKDPARRRHQLMVAELEVRNCGGEVDG